MSSNTPIVFTRLSTYDQFCQLEAEWDSLAAGRVNTIFLTHAWLSQWWLVYGSAYRLWILTARVENKLVGIVPLMLSTNNVGLRQLMFMGAGEVTPNHLDLIARPEYHEAVAKALADYLLHARSEWDVLELEKIPAESRTVEILNEVFHQHAIETQVETNVRCPYADLPDTFDLFLCTRSASTRDNLRHVKRYLTRDFASVSYCCAETQEDVTSAMDTLVRLHQARWTKKGYTGSFSSPQFIQFHHQMAIKGLQSRTLRLYYLKIGMETAAVCYCYRTADTVQFYLGSFDEQWMKYSLGSVINAYAIEQSISEGVKRFDFLEGEERYKEWWMTGIQENRVLRVYNPNWRGRIMQRYIETTQHLMTWGVQAVPVNVRRPIWQAYERTRAWMRLHSGRK